MNTFLKRKEEKIKIKPFPKSKNVFECEVCFHQRSFTLLLKACFYDGLFLSRRSREVVRDNFL